MIVVAGLIIGSFINVLSYRIPKDLPVIFSRSICPKCNSLIPLYRNIPMISYILQNGKCHNCNKKILTFNHDFKKFDYLWWVKFSNNIFYNLSELDHFLNEENQKLNKELSNHYIANLDSINESSRIISQYTKSVFKYSNPSFLKLINELFFVKSIWGTMIRNFIIKNLKNPFGIIKEGLAMDYFRFKNINK